MKTKSAILLLILSSISALHAADWPQWRGPTRDGQLTGAAWPDKLDTNHLKQAWRVDLGPSHSGPIVAGDRVFTTETKDKRFEVDVALDDKGGMMGGVFSSPVFAELAGKRQLVVQMREKLAGVKLADGKVLWEHPIEAFRGMNILTPVVHGDTLFTSTHGGKTIGFKVAQADGKFTVTESSRHKAQGYMTTPVIVDGFSYTTTAGKRAPMFVNEESSVWTFFAEGCFSGDPFAVRVTETRGVETKTVGESDGHTMPYSGRIN